MSPALALMGIYIMITAVLQFVGFLISHVVSTFAPTMSLMTFLVLFLGMFWLGWPIAVRITNRLIPVTEAELQRQRGVVEGESAARLEKTNLRRK
jgi:uncharacterized membrane protein YqjE